jgi:formylglycine-generating enzyme required for sulfatase activity
MIAIPGGSFMMGSPDGEGYGPEKPQHKVTIQPFYMGKYPVTQAQWQAIMGNNPSRFKGDKLPVESVSWLDAQEFCKALSKKTGKEYRLPSKQSGNMLAGLAQPPPITLAKH